MTDVWERPLSGAWVAPARRWTVVVASALFLAPAGVFAAVSDVSARSNGERQVVVGPWNDGTLLMASVVASVVLLAVIVIAVPAPRWWLLLLVPLRVLAVAAALLGGVVLALADESVTPIVADGCDTGYVVSERAFLRASSGEVLRLDGVIGTWVTATRVDNGHKPFAERSYLAVTDGTTVRVRHTARNASDGVSTADDPQFVLPRIRFAAGCGLAGGEPAVPSADPWHPDPDEGPIESVASDTRERVAAMAALTVDAAEGTAVDATGSPVRPPAASELPCDGTTGVELVFATDDNAASYAAILGAWSAAGYAPDRAMQEDIRDDGTVRLSARDRTTIDGMLHLRIGGPCVTR